MLKDALQLQEVSFSLPSIRDIFHAAKDIVPSLTPPFLDWLLLLAQVLIEFYYLRSDLIKHETFLFILLRFLLIWDICLYVVIIFHDMPSFFMNQPLSKEYPFLREMYIFAYFMHYFISLSSLGMFSFMIYAGLHWPLRYCTWTKRRAFKVACLSLITLFSLFMTLLIGTSNFSYSSTLKSWHYNMNQESKAICYHYVNLAIQVVMAVFYSICVLFICINYFKLKHRFNDKQLEVEERKCECLRSSTGKALGPAEKLLFQTDRQTGIKGVLFPKYVVQFAENETLTDVDRLEIFNSWGKITTAERNSIEIVRQDAICYPGPIMNGSLFMCGFLTRVNETLAEAREFFQEARKLIESNGTTSSKQNIDATILSEFSRHWEAVSQLQQSLQLAQGSFTELDDTIELGLDLLNYFSLPTIQTLITGSFEDNQNSSHTRPISSKKKPCPWTSTEIDAFLQSTGAPFDWLQQLMFGNDTRLDQDICGISKELSLASIIEQINGTTNLLPTLPLAIASVSSIKATLSSSASSPASIHAPGNLAKDVILAEIGPKYTQLQSILSKSFGSHNE